jgi:hypothetical protein
MVRPFPSFAVWARDHGVERMVEAAAQKLTTSGPVYRLITKAAYCLADLRSADFPASLQEDVSVLRSVSKYIGHFPDGRTGSAIPQNLLSQWVQSFMRIRDHLLIAKGRYDGDESRAKDGDI